MEHVRVLIVDDSATKADNIANAAKSVPGVLVTVAVADCRETAIGHLQESRWDLVVLDMHLPRSRGRDPDPDVGWGLLQMMQDRALPAPMHVIGLTAYAEAVDGYGARFSALGWTLARYEASDTSWEHLVQDRIRYIVGSRHSTYGLDVAILCALQHPEMSAVLDLPYGWTWSAHEDDPTRYAFGSGNVGARAVRVVAMACDQMGMPSTAALAMKAIEMFRPRVLIMAGIAAGRNRRPGDVLIAEETWDSGAGKVRNFTTFEPAPSQARGSPHLINVARQLAADDTVLQDLQGAEGYERPRIVVGPLASGAAVVASRPHIERLIGANRKLIGVEMEAHGLYRAVELSRGARPAALVAKGTCDFGDEEKDDRWQGLAARNSAVFVDRLIRVYFA